MENYFNLLKIFVAVPLFQAKLKKFTNIYILLFVVRMTIVNYTVNYLNIYMLNMNSCLNGRAYTVKTCHEIKSARNYITPLFMVV